jgi:hypothetical protein
MIATLPAVDGQPIFQAGALSLEQLFSLHSALSTVAGVIAGLTCQPKFQDDDGLSSAGEMLDKFLEFTHTAMEEIHNEAVERTPASRIDRNRKFFFLAHRYADGLSHPEYALSEITAGMAGLGKAVAK